LRLSLDRQVVSQDCPECAVRFTVVRGSVLDEGNPIGLYLIALHGHDVSGKLAHLAIAVMDHSAIPPHSFAAAMVVRATGEQFTFSLNDWAASPWKDEKYLGEMLDRSAVLVSPHKGLFFHIADHVVSDLSEVGEYLGS
jgi:hypothetical protein